MKTCGKAGRWKGVFRLAVCVLALAPASWSEGPRATCTRVTAEGEVSAGRIWEAPLGNGWSFRLVPIQPAEKYSGWDMVVDRAKPALGFPDALYLATPPYGSLNEREVGTTYGLRAQDAVGWNPRSFRFLTDEAAYRAAQQAYHALPKGPAASGSDEASARLLKLIGSASAGELRILEARLATGVADPVPYAQRWALAAAHTSQKLEQGQPSPRGMLNGIRFAITLWLPAGWNAPPPWHATPGVCVQ